MIRRAARIEARLVPHRWAWAEAARDAVAAHWASRKAATPAMFDGRVLMVAEARWEGDALRAAFFETAYSNLLAWLEWGAPDLGVRNGFAMAALTAADGAFLLGEMGAHTAHAGEAYFPAGTPDLADVRQDGSVDLEGSLVRELAEETGLVAGEWVVEPGWTVVEEGGYLALLRGVRLPWPAAAARARILTNLAADPEPELAGIRIVRGPADIDERAMPGYLTAFLRRSFAGQG